MAWDGTTIRPEDEDGAVDIVHSDDNFLIRLFHMFDSYPCRYYKA